MEDSLKDLKSQVRLLHLKEQLLEGLHNKIPLKHEHERQLAIALCSNLFLTYSREEDQSKMRQYYRDFQF